MRNFKDNLLVQFSVVTFVIMVILAMIVAFVLIAALNRNIELTRDYLLALESGEAIGPDDPVSLEALTNQVDNLKWVTLAAIGGSFIYLYATLVYLVWEGWKTIVRQRVELETANAELEDRVAERVEQLREAMGEGQRRLDAFRTAAGRLGLEEVPENALQDLVDVSRELIGARFGVLSLLDSRGATGKFITSGFAPEKPGRIVAPARSLTELGLTKKGKDRIVVADPELLRKAHGLQEGALTADGLIGVPVVLTGGASGAFYLMEKTGGASFSIDDEELLNLFAVLAGVHLENLNLYEEVALERRTLAAIQSSMTEGLVVVDPAGQVMYLNGTAEQLWDLKPDDVQGKPISEVLDAKASDFDSPDALAELLQSISNGTSDEPLTIDVKMEKPQTRYLEVTSFHIPAGSDESMTGLLARDVTQEREMAEQRDSFVSIASHELRTPMTTIMGFSELLLNNSDLPEDSRREWLQRIHQNSQVLSAIVDDMLDVSRIQTGRLGINWEDLRIKDIVDEVLVGIKAETDEHEFSVNVAADLPTVAADREKLTQIVINLLTNAVKYSPKGGTITVSANGDADNGRVVVEVADQGMGIVPENIDQLFNSFHRISRPETEGIRGTGLGLSIVKGLAQLMRGDAWVESELNVGSRFFFSVNTQQPNVTEEEDALSAV